jgi:asparagine synthase (glutamine-hydrolysing)
MNAFAGIIALHGQPLDPAHIARMGAVLSYRARFGMQSAQPNAGVSLIAGRASPGEDGVYSWGGCAIVADARIDDASALGERVRAAGVGLVSAPSDAALILGAYLAFGTACVEYLLGDYVFAIWDGRSQTLFTARDPIGSRLFYHVLTPDCFAFSSEVRPLKMLPGVDLRHHPLYIADFLMLGEAFLIDRTQTPFQGIRRMDRGHVLTLERGTLTDRAFWSVPEQVQPRSFRRPDEVIEAFRGVFEAAVRDRLRGDRVVLTLSGGMDSSTATATAADIIRREKPGMPFTVLTSVYRQIADPELPYARETAAHLKIDGQHTLYEIPRYRMFTPYVHIANAIRQSLVPSQWIEFQGVLAQHGDTAMFAYMGDALLSDETIAQAARRMTPVAALRAYRQLWRHFGKRPALGTGILRRDPTAGQSPPFPAWINPDFVREYDLLARWEGYWTSRRSPITTGGSAYLVRMLKSYDFYMRDESDAFTFTPVDVVDPFADLRVIRFLLALPPLPWFHQKYLLRRMMAGRLPPAVLSRPKQIIGDLAAHMLMQPENAWVDHWQPIEDARQYIVRERIPLLTGKHAQLGHEQGVHLRPLLLDRWLRGEHAARGRA